MKLKDKLRLVSISNKVFEYTIYAICLFVIALPYLPKVAFLADKYVFASNEYVATPTIPNIDVSIDKLVIPAIGVDTEVIEATNMKVVHEKVWRRPQGSTPDMGSNTVLVAHRYATIGGNRASTFYNLPELAIGEKIYVAWQGHVYAYEIYETMIVDPTAIEIEAPTAEPILTLYTCTPLWTATHRYVVKAKLISS